MDINNLVSKIKLSNSVDEATKKKIIAGLQEAQQSGDDAMLMEKLNEVSELIGDIQSGIEDKIDAEFEKAGITDEKSSPGLKKDYEKMSEDLSKAEADLQSGLEGLMKESDATEDNAMKQLDQIDIQQAQDKLGKA